MRGRVALYGLKLVTRHALNCNQFSRETKGVASTAGREWCLALTQQTQGGLTMSHLDPEAESTPTKISSFVAADATPSRARPTTGPWEWVFEDTAVMALYGPKGPEDHVLWAGICDACAKRGARCTAPNDANARLIAEAPEMLTLLTELYEESGPDNRPREEIWCEVGMLIDRVEGTSS